jgi:hypothetical protein
MVLVSRRVRGMNPPIIGVRRDLVKGLVQEETATMAEAGGL